MRMLADRVLYVLDRYKWLSVRPDIIQGLTLLHLKHHQLNTHGQHLILLQVSANFIFSDKAFTYITYKNT